jgi:hypothetical protein
MLEERRHSAASSAKQRFFLSFYINSHWSNKFSSFVLWFHKMMKWIYVGFISMVWTSIRHEIGENVKWERMKKQWKRKVHCWSWQKYFSLFSFLVSVFILAHSNCVWKVKGSLFKCRWDQRWFLINSSAYNNFMLFC